MAGAIRPLLASIHALVWLPGACGPGIAGRQDHRPDRPGRHTPTHHNGPRSQFARSGKRGTRAKS